MGCGGQVIFMQIQVFVVAHAPATEAETVPGGTGNEIRTGLD